MAIEHDPRSHIERSVKNSHMGKRQLHNIIYSYSLEYTNAEHHRFSRGRF